MANSDVNGHYIYSQLPQEQLRQLYKEVRGIYPPIEEHKHVYTFHPFFLVEDDGTIKLMIELNDKNANLRAHCCSICGGPVYGDNLFCEKCREELEEFDNDQAEIND